MRINFSDRKTFKGLRQDRAFVRQLMTENGYSLAENNQKNILKAINNIAQNGTISGTKFLLETAENMRYATNIKFNKQPKNKWMSAIKLALAATASAGLLNKISVNFNSIFAEKDLSNEEKEIMSIHYDILDKMKKYNPAKEEYDEARNNLEYFIISSETSLGDKKYILDKLNYFLSDDYKINEQLEDKKFQAFSEIINDLALDKVSGKAPNIKDSNQNTHGMCTVFSITRKLLAYEYKRNYVDFIMQELDNSDEIMVYDRKALGQGKKVPVKKANIDYAGMLRSGFRIVDASAANWMQIADSISGTKDIKIDYIPYNSATFNVYNDSHKKTITPEANIHKKSEYLEAIVITESKLKSLKRIIIQQKLATAKQRPDAELEKAKNSRSIINELEKIFSSMFKDEYKEMSHDVVDAVMSLQKQNSQQINNDEQIAHEYLYIDNEEEAIKRQKIKSYITDRYDFAINREIKDSEIDTIYELIEDYKVINSDKSISQFGLAQSAIKAAAAFRNQMIKACEDPERLHNLLVSMDFANEDAIFLNNIQSLIDKVNAGNTFIIKSLSDNIGIEYSKEEVLEFLTSSKEYVENLPYLYDELYKRLNLGNRKEALLKELNISLTILDSNDDTEIQKLKSTIGIYDNTELRKRLNDALGIMHYRPTIEKYSKMLSCKDTKEDVKRMLKNVLYEITYYKNDKLKKEIAADLKINPNKVTETLIKTGDLLSGVYDEYTYEEASNLINQKSIKNDFLNYYNQIINTLQNGVNEQFLKDLLVNNGLEPEFTEENLSQLPEKMLTPINEMAQTINTIAQMLYIEKDGDIINSVYNPHVVIMTFEKMGVVAPASLLKKYNKKFDEYYKLSSSRHSMSQDEYKQAKKKLTLLDRTERAEINKILSVVNTMYSVTKKEKDIVYRMIKDEYSEVYRQLGLNNGRYWQYTVPSSGLSSEKEAVLLEMVTDKPYFVQKDIKQAFKDIKHGKNSGITSTSVSDTQIGLHAQYIASIDTIKVPSKENPAIMEEKDVLFHDNSWGEAESENVWTDSQGLKRTDYNSDFGYRNGYITNEYYRNGNFIEYLLNNKGEVKQPKIENKQLKKLSNSNENYSFELVDDVIMQGKSNKASSLAKSIRDLLLTNDSDNINVLEGYASSMTIEELRNRLKNLNEISMGYGKTYEEMRKRIIGNKFEKGIETEEEYNSLPDDDKLKIMLEKAALRKRFPNSIYTENIDDIKSLKDLRELEESMREELKDKFYYTFGKSNKAVNYALLNKNVNEIIERFIVPILEKDNIKLTTKEIAKVFNDKKIQQELTSTVYDGSLRSLSREISNEIVNGIIEIYKEKVPVTVAKELRDGISGFIYDLYKLKPEDINSNNIPQNIIDWIDKTYKPETDEEFIKIFNMIQNYNSIDFERKIMSQISQEDLGIEEYSGYDLLKSIRLEQEQGERALINEAFFDEYSKVYEISKTKPYIRYERFNTKVTGATYVKKKFDDIYMTLRYMLSQITYEKLFAKYKEQNYKKYNALPSYPMLDLSDSRMELTEKSLSMIKTAFTKASNLKRQITVIETAEEIYNFVKSNKDKSLTEAEFKELQNQAKKFIINSKDFKEFNPVVSALLKIITADKTINLKDYEPSIEQLNNICLSLLSLCSKEEYYQKLKETELDLERSKAVFLRIKINPQHRDRIHAVLNEWFDLMRKESPKAEEKYNEILDLSEKHHIMNTPNKILDDYLELFTKDGNEGLAKREVVKPAIKNTLNTILQSAKYIGIQEILMQAERNGLTGAIAAEFDNIDVELNNNKERTGKSIEQMSSPKILTLMLRSIMFDNNFDAAKNFVEKLNLEDKVIPALLASEDVTIAETVVKDLLEEKEKIMKEYTVIEELRNKIANIKNTDAEGTKAICKEIISELKSKGYNNKNNYFISNIIATFENTLEVVDFKSIENIETSLFIGNILEAVLIRSFQDGISELTDMYSYFSNAEIVDNFLSELTITSNPKLEQQINDYHEWYNNLLAKWNKAIMEINSIKIG